MKQATIGFAMTGSFCTLDPVIRALEDLAARDVQLVPIMSENAYSLDSRFGEAAQFVRRVEQICGRPVLHTQREVEPLGPKALLDALVIGTDHIHGGVCLNVRCDQRLVHRVHTEIAGEHFTRGQRCGYRELTDFVLFQCS